MLCQKCKATVNLADRFCPRCGSPISVAASQTQHPAPQSGFQVIQAAPVEAQRAEERRVPIPEIGKKYVGLSTAAGVMITSAAVIRIICYVLGGLTFISVAMWLRWSLLGFLLGSILGAGVILIGWLLWLIFTVLGELMYVIIDIEENMRRRV